MGPTPAFHTANIDIVYPTGRKVSAPDTAGQTVEETRNVIPVRYNLKCEFRAEVTRNSGQQFDYYVRSKK